MKMTQVFSKIKASNYYKNQEKTSQAKQNKP
jgi:hypothetical protein